jgi:hypothetical protein
VLRDIDELTRETRAAPEKDKDAAILDCALAQPEKRREWTKMMLAN